MSTKNNTSQPVRPSRTQPPIEMKGALQAHRWVSWAAVAVAGLLLAVGGGWSSQQSQNSVARTAMVVADMQTGVQALANDSMMAARGNPGSIDNLRTWRNKVGVSMTLLEKGGYAAPTDPAPVLGLQDLNRVSLDALNQGLSNFDKQIRPLEESGAQLRDAAAAENTLTEALVTIDESLGSIGRSASLNGGSWGGALADIKGVLQRPEMKTMRVIFSPLPGAETLQSSWSQQFSKTASQMSLLSDAAEKDATLSQSAKAQVSRLSDAVQKLAVSTAVLAQTQSVRLAAQQMQDPIQAAVASIQQPLDKVGTDVLAMQSTRPMSFYLAWLGMAMVLVGILGLSRATMVMSQDHWVASQESRLGQGMGDAMERLTRHLRRIVVQDGALMGNGRLEEDADSPSFALASMINRLLESQDRFKQMVSGAMETMGQVLSDVSGPGNRINGLSTRIQENSDRSSGLARSMARELARLAQSSGPKSAQKMVEMTTAAELIMQEGTFKMDAMRETVQATSKRLKRLAEGAQNIAAATDVIDGISRRVKVLSTNAAIEAAAHGEDGRRFAVLAKEIERLSQSAHEAAGDIGRVVQSIQVDAQETVAAMEQSTSEVVASSELTARASNALRDIERAAADLSRELEISIREVEKQALSGVKLSQQCDEAAAVGKEALQESGHVSSSIEKARTATRDIKDRISKEK